MTTYILCADGACSGNPGPGGYAWELWSEVVADGNQVIAGSGSSAATTNNIMELSSALDAFETFLENGVFPGLVRMRLDSQYVLKGIFEYMPNWKPRGWRTAAGKDVANVELWKRLDAALIELKSRGFTFEPNWVKGHAGDIGNERVDAKSVEMRDQAKFNATTDAKIDSDLRVMGVPMPTYQPAGIDLMAIAEDTTVVMTPAAPAAANGDITPEQVGIMRGIFASFEAGDISIKDVIAEVRKNAGALGC
ncbi:ribonuclease H family protein [Loktanella sp. DJP18]|uniref:ribonuclease H family protein n=1 Tax=Loktanella sp. DJP18 TaxID=3409788 RepID=UPI003BB73C97